jgi:hypothetical protein
LSFTIDAPISVRTVDPVRGEVRRDVAAVPPIAVELDQRVQYAPANAELDRLIDVQLRSADEQPRDALVSLRLPSGLVADSASRGVRFTGPSDARLVTFRVRGRLAPGLHRIEASAKSGRDSFSMGYQLIDYDHIRPQRIYRAATTVVSAVDVRLSSRLRVAYVAGASDNVAPTLSQLGVRVTEIPAREISRADLRPYSTVVIGPRAYEVFPELVAANQRLLEFVRAGGTLVVQYGQYEMMQPGIMPYPIMISRPHDRVTHEDAPVRVVDASARVLRTPNQITAGDFAGWVQERALYMPRIFDEHYRGVLEMNDPGDPANRGAILIGQLGRGTYVYTTLSFFRQLPAGVPGAARLFVNLLSAGLSSTRATP